MTDTARKDDAGKPRYSLIPVDALREVAQLFTDGAKKYGDRNWEKGMEYSRVYDALQRHAEAWLEGQDRDQDPNGSRQLNMASVAWCAMALISYHLRGVGTDDRPGQASGPPVPASENPKANVLKGICRWAYVDLQVKPPRPDPDGGYIVSTDSKFSATMLFPTLGYDTVEYSAPVKGAPAFDPTKPVQTRGGDPARIIEIGIKGEYGETMLAMTSENGEIVQLKYFGDGKLYANRISHLDLINVSTERKENSNGF